MNKMAEMSRRHRAVAVLFAVVIAISASVAAYSATSGRSTKASAAVVLKLDLSQPTSYFARGAVGLSMEAAELHRGRLTPRHGRLVRLMRLLGPSLLRIDGGTVDRTWWTSSGEPAPPWATSIVTPADLSLLHGLLVATGWQVLLGVNFGHFDPARAADEARYARTILGSRLRGIELGNEPNSYARRPDGFRAAPYGPTQYLHDVEGYKRPIEAAAPGLAVYGPDLSDPAWLAELGGGARVFAELTQHYYPVHELDTCPSTSALAPQPTADELLSPAIRQQEEILVRALLLAGGVAGRPTRIDETNSVSCRPTIYADPGFAGALWALDWSLRAASAGIRGLNFHGGPYPCLLYPESPICADGNGAAASAGDVTAQPEYYGLLAARQLEGGRFIRARLVSGHAVPPNVTTWATASPGGTIKIALVDLNTGGSAVPIWMPSTGYAVSEQVLRGPAVDATTGISLGGSSVTDDGVWKPRIARRIRGRRSVKVLVRPASAVIVTMYPIGSRG